MNRIDAAVVMPRGASPLGKYARYYAYRPDGKIAVFYTAYVDEGRRPSDYGCAELTLNDAMENVPCPPSTDPKAGSQQWVALDRMPDASDGGCSIINAVYDPARRRVESIACNGPI